MKFNNRKEVEEAYRSGIRFFTGAKLSRLDLRGLVFRDCDFSFADLGGSDFEGSDLSGSDFSYAKVDGTNFHGLSGISPFI